MKYLRADKLHIGDVILVRSPGKPSTLISAATSGPYSHAAIYAGHLRLFEAQGDGVGYTRLKLIKVEVHRGHPRLFCDVSQYDQLDIYRVPESARPEDLYVSTFGVRFSRILSAYHGLDYSNLERLATASAIGRASPRFSSKLMWALGLIAAGDRHKELPGPFCSELVVEALTQAGFSLLNDVREARTISPSDLSDPAITRLERQNRDEYLEPVDPSIPNDDVWFGMFQPFAFPTKQEMREIKVRGKGIDVFTNKLLHDLASAVAESASGRGKPRLKDRFKARFERLFAKAK